MSNYRLEARHASKTFGSTIVLSDAELMVEPGEIHALIGQNGSGKSTLVKILTGYHSPDSGMTLAIDGEQVRLPVSWDAVSAAGVSVVHQDLGLRDDATVAENIGVGGFTCSRFFRRIDWKKMHQVAREVLGRLEVDIDPAELASNLNATERAVVAIARALREQKPGEGIMILDESTRALPREELELFHALLKRVVAQGTSVVLVTHNLEEVLALADCVTILRDGRVVASHVPTAGLAEQDLAKQMLGKTVDSVRREKTSMEDRPVAVALTGVAAEHDAVPLDLEIRSGEIVGITGMPGSPYAVLPYVIGGARRAAAGSARIGKESLNLVNGSTMRCLGAGVVLVPERRDRDGLAYAMSIRDNIALPNLRRRGRRWYAGRGWQRSVADDAINRFSIKAPNSDMLVKELSGGNQQKVLFAKWMSVGPKVLVLHEPTQAVDVGARRDILESIQAAAETGVGVLLASAEVTDLVDICDRIFVIDLAGRAHEIHPETPDDVVDAVYATTTTPIGG